MDKKIIKNAGVSFHANTELEQWRAETLLKKEPETIAWLRHYACVGSVFFDIGANIGTYSMYAALLNPRLNVYAFEPVLGNYCALLDNISLNSAENVFAFQVALSSKNNLTSLYLQDRRIGNSGAQIHHPLDEKGNKFDHVAVQKILGLSVNSMVKDLGFPCPNFVKIDVDGHEKDILDGMDLILGESLLQSILVEFNSTEEREIYTKFLGKFNFLPDVTYNNHPEHSTKRRAEKNGTAVNCVFTKK
jgi:FkbM family methyltransferase